MMNSEDSCKRLDLESCHPTSPGDSASQKSLRAHAQASLAAYLEYLAQFPAPSSAQLRAKKGPRGTPFSLAAKTGDAPKCPPDS